ANAGTAANAGTVATGPTAHTPAAGTAGELTAAERLVEQLAADRVKLRREILFTALTGIGLAVGLVTGWGRDVLPLVALAGYVLAYLAGGVPAARRSLRALVVRRKLSISFLMVLAAVAAAL